MHSHSLFMCKLRIIQSRFLNAFHIFPFCWNPTKKLFTCVSKKQHTNFCRVALMFPFVTLFQFIQLVILMHSGKFNKITYLYLELILNALIVVNSYVVVWRRDEYLGFINGNLELANRIASKKNICTEIIYVEYDYF